MDEKYILSDDNLVGFIYNNLDIESNNVPEWFIRLNQRFADPGKFKNAEDYSPDMLDILFENALTTIWTRITLEKIQTGEIEEEINIYESKRIIYIDNVRQRLDTIYELRNTLTLEYTVIPFRVFDIDDVVIRIVRNDKTEIQKIKTEEKRLIETSKVLIDNNVPN